MTFSTKEFEMKGEEVVHWLEREFAGVRTGRATPALLDLVQVESYGSRVPIVHVGSVSVEDPRTLRVSIWDAQSVKATEKAIIEADLGVSVVADGSGLRVIFPELTSERRAQLLKIAKAKHEEARVSLRGVRDEIMKDIEARSKAKEMSDDEKTGARDAVQKKVEAFNTKFDELLALKEKEIAH